MVAARSLEFLSQMNTEVPEAAKPLQPSAEAALLHDFIFFVSTDILKIACQ